METIKEFLEFLWMVISNWAVLATGGVIMAVAWVWYTWRKECMNRSTMLILCGLFFIVACFAAWRDERTHFKQSRLAWDIEKDSINSDLQKLQSHKPDLVASFDQMSWGPTEGAGGQLSNGTIILIQMSL
jgi:hypothetical protein